MTIDEIKQLLKEISPWPWRASRDLMTFEIFQKAEPNETVAFVGPCREGCDIIEDHDDKIFKQRWDTTNFIAQSPTIISELVDKLEKAKIALVIIGWDMPEIEPDNYAAGAKIRFDIELARQTLKELE